MRVVFRYDDFSAAPSIPFEVDAGLFDVFRRLEIPLIVGVTPRMSADPRDASNSTFFDFEGDERRVSLLTDGLDRGWQAALHGFTHQRGPILDGSEFKGLSPEAQTDKIRKGLAILNRCLPNTPVNVFIPPWNSFDRVTLGCLESLGFSMLYGGDEIRINWKRPVRYIPSLFTPSDLAAYISRYSIKDLERISGNASIVVTLHHYEFWDRSCAGYIGLDAMRELLQRIREANLETTTLTSESSSLGFVRHVILSEEVRRVRGLGRQKLCASKEVDPSVPNPVAKVRISEMYSLLRWSIRKTWEKARWVASKTRQGSRAKSQRRHH